MQALKAQVRNGHFVIDEALICLRARKWSCSSSRWRTPSLTWLPRTAKSLRKPSRRASETLKTAITSAPGNSWPSCEPRTLEGRTIEARPAGCRANRRTLAKTCRSARDFLRGDAGSGRAPRDSQQSRHALSNEQAPATQAHVAGKNEVSKCHLYFVSDERKQRIDVLHVWDGRRERLPAL